MLGALAAAGAAGCSGTLRPAGSSAGSSARPSASQTTITLLFESPWTAPWNSTAVALNQQFFDENYTPQHHGVRVAVQWHPLSAKQQSAEIAASLAGKGFPDVIETGEYAALTFSWLASGLLVPLEPLVTSANVDLSAWSASQIQASTYHGTLVGLPSRFGPSVIYYRRDILDGLGLGTPDPQWDLQQAQQIWTACVQPQSGGGFRTGFAIQDGAAAFAQINWLLRGWGASEMNGTGTSAQMDSAGGTALGAFLQTGFADHSLSSNTSAPVTSLQQQHAVFNQNGTWAILQLLTGLPAVPWDILPVPSWPAGRSTFGPLNFYALNSASTQQEAAWELLIYAAQDPAYQRFLMRTTLDTPGLLNLWQEWQTAVVAAAPGLKNKQVQWVADAAVNGYAWGPEFFRYDTAQVDSAINAMLPRIEHGQLSPQLAMRQLAQQIDALETVGAAHSTQAAAG